MYSKARFFFNSFLIFIVVILLIADLKLSDFQQTNEISRESLCNWTESSSEFTKNTNGGSV
jgi:hypothetical protein